MDFITAASFLFITALVAVLTWLFTRNDDHETSTGYFLAGRSLSFPLIAGSLLLTNLSTEQMVGLNGSAFTDGLCVMVWEVVCVVALVFMAWFFLPRFLKSGVTTVPEYLGIRYDDGTRFLTNIIFLVAYVLVLLPVILYTGATGLASMLKVDELLGSLPAATGVAPEMLALWITVWLVGIIGACYALFGGLRTVAVSDTLNGVGLLIGGLLVTYFALNQVSDGQGMVAGMNQLYETQKERFNSVGSKETGVPFGTIFSGIFLLNLFYWTTNQQIIQRTFAASSLAEGQKGVLLTGALKLLGPLYLVIPGMIAYQLYHGGDVAPDQAYGKLVGDVLPSYLTGFFAAVMIGAILSSFNSALNSACTLFSLGFYKRVINRSATDRQQVRAGAMFGALITLTSMLIAPMLAGQTQIFSYLQKMNGLYFIPIFAVVLVGMLTKRVPPLAAKVGIVFSVAVLLIGYFVHPFNLIVSSLHEFHFLGIVFAWTVILMLVIGEIYPQATEFDQKDVQAVDMTPWKLAPLAGGFLIVAVAAIYWTFADFTVLDKPSADVDVPSPAAVAEPSLENVATPAIDLETGDPSSE